MNRHEIELLIRARADADAAFSKLNTHLKNLTGEQDRTGESSERMNRRLKDSQATGVAAGVVFGNLATVLGRKVHQAFTSTITEANRLDSSLIGLSSIAVAFGGNADRAQEAARRLAADGLMTVSDAAAGLKNLLGAGFGLDEAITLMERFKDSAAFGRQGALGFGEAIVGATQGIKNGNSILVDNVGITKNLSQILVEAGFSQNDLNKATSDANVRRALYNGLLKESNPMVGDAAKLLETAAGAQSQFNAQVVIAQQNIGKELQPILVAWLNTMRPLVKVVAENADSVVILGGAASAAIAPVVALRAAAALGIRDFGGLTAGVRGTIAIFREVRTVSDFGAAVKRTGEAAGTALLSLSPYTVALGGLAAGALIAKKHQKDLADEVERFNEIIEKSKDRRSTLSEADGRLRLMQDEYNAAVARGNELQAAKIRQEMNNLRSSSVYLDVQREVSKAVESGAEASISYADAVQFNADKLTVAIARNEALAGVVNTSATAQKELVSAQERLGIITQEQANLRLLEIDREQRANEVLAKRINLSSFMTTAEQQVNVELRNTGESMATMVSWLEKSELSFKAWAERMGLSKEAIARVEAELKKKTDGLKAHEKELDQAAAAEKKWQDQMASAGLRSVPQLREALAELARMEAEATAQGAPLSQVMAVLMPQFEALYEDAKLSGLGLDEATAALRRAQAAWAAGLPPIQGLPEVNHDYSQFLRIGTDVSYVLSEQHRRALDLSAAYKHFGVTGTAALTTTAQASVRLYNTLVESGTATPDEIRRAFEQMVEDVNAANGRIPSFWSEHVAPNVIRSLETMETAVSGSFAQMLIGAKGFKDGWTDIWSSIKASTLNIFNQIVDAFMKNVIGKIINALSGNRGAMSGGLGNLVGSLLGGGAQAGAFAGLPGISLGPLGPAPGAAGAGAAAGAGGFAAGGFAGFLAGGGAAAGGLLLGKMLGDKYGRAGGAFGGAAGGAATGAMIGSVVPGLGTVVGGIVGGAAGLIGGIIGGGKNNTKEQREQFAQSLGYRNIDALFAALSEQAPEQADALRHRALNVIGKKDDAANQRWMEDVIAAFSEAKKAQEDFASAQDALAAKYRITWEDMGQAARQAHVDEEVKTLLDDNKKLTDLLGSGDAAIRKQAGAFSELVQAIRRTGTTIDPALEPMLQRLIDMGLLVDENGRKFESMSDVMTVRSAETLAQIKALEEERKSLVDSIAEEQANPEYDADGNRIYGVIEQQALDRIAAIDEERKKIDELTEEALPAVAEESDVTGRKIADMFARLKDEGIEAFWGVFSTLDQTDEHVKEALEKARALFEQTRFNPLFVPVEFDYRNAPDAPSVTIEPPAVTGAANGVFATAPLLRVFGEKEPELGGPVGFMSKALSGAIEQMGLSGFGRQSGDVYLDSNKVGRILFRAGVEDARRRGVVRTS